MSRHIHQEITIAAKPEQLYAFLTQAERFAEVTGAPAEIESGEGGAFSLFGGMIEGRQVSCVEGSRVVQAWRPQPWEAGMYSLVRFELKASRDHTLVVMDHTGFPDGQKEHLSEGWHDNYWSKLQAHFG